MEITGNEYEVFKNQGSARYSLRRDNSCEQIDSALQCSCGSGRGRGDLKINIILETLVIHFLSQLLLSRPGLLEFPPP